jgi:hypothetical protein
MTLQEGTWIYGEDAVSANRGKKCGDPVSPRSITTQQEGTWIYGGDAVSANRGEKCSVPFLGPG